MKFAYLGLVAGIAACLSGCTTYRYRVVQPATDAPAVAAAPVTIHDDPLDYHFFRYRDHLGVQVTNPTDDRIALQGNRSFVVDPRGETHPIRDRALAPHSFTRFLFPPIPFSYAYPDYWLYGPGWGWGWGYGWGWYGPRWAAWYGPGWWGPPTVSYQEVLTPYDWEWKTGLVRIKLTYERAGKVFEHNFEIAREPDHK